MLLNKKISTTLLTAVLAIGIGSQAYAATTGETETDITINAGPVEIVSTPVDLTFSNIEIDGLTQTLSGELGSLNMNDFRGVADGWDLNVQASEFASTVDPSNKLGPNILRMTDGTPLITSTGSGIAPTYKILAPSTIDGGSDVNVLSAASGAGTGAWNIDFHPNSLFLTVDTASVILDSGAPTVFSSTLTWTVVTGP